MTQTPPKKLDDHAFARRHKEAWTFIKALAVGCISAGPEVLSYMLLCPWLAYLGVTYLPRFFLFDIIVQNIDDPGGYGPAVLVYAFILSTMVGQSIGFVLSRKYAFRANCNVALSTFLTVLLIVFTIIANGFTGPWIVLGVSKIPFLTDGLIQMFGKLFSMGASTFWVYPANRFIIHRVVKEKSFGTNQT